MLEEPGAIESYTADTSATPTRDRCHPQMADRRDAPAVVLDGKGQKEAWDDMSVKVLKDCVRGPLRVHTMWGKDVEVLGGPQDFFKTLCEGIKVSVAEEGVIFTLWTHAFILTPFDRAFLPPPSAQSKEVLILYLVWQAAETRILISMLDIASGDEVTGLNRDRKSVV